MRCLLIFGVLLLCGCTKEVADAPPLIVEVPRGFPSVQAPADNPLSEAKIELGRMLFYDPILSVDSSTSCASCHQQERAFTDGLAKSTGVFGHTALRNASSLANVAYNDFFLREGGVNTLEKQVLVPIEDENEMGFNMVLLVERLRNHGTYPTLFSEVFEEGISPFSITRSIAAFERTLISGHSSYDQFLNGNKDALTVSAKRGMALFFDNRTSCSSCHNGFNFTNNGFENNGLYAELEDTGRFRLTFNASDIGKFKVPSLRNISITAPYMHDGSLETLKEVVDHYNKGGQGHINQHSHIEPLGLSDQEMNDLVNFLESLTDSSFVVNPAFSNPFM